MEGSCLEMWNLSLTGVPGSRSDSILGETIRKDGLKANILSFSN